MCHSQLESHLAIQGAEARLRALSSNRAPTAASVLGALARWAGVWRRVPLPGPTVVRHLVACTLLLALIGCSAIEPIRGTRIPGMPHDEQRYVAVLGDQIYLVDARFVDSMEQTVIAVRLPGSGSADNRREIVISGAVVPEGSFFDDAIKPTAVAIAERVGMEGVCPDGEPFNLAHYDDGSVKAFFYQPRDAWTVFAYCGDGAPTS
ncbi:MAG: hypothetical protein AAGE18_19365 [Pseudomonadota bacterium]